MPTPKAFCNALLDWYDQHKRDLPWRKTTDPYAIWISEIMLQQTQVPRVQKQYFPAFLTQFPTVETLARATWEEVFPVWQGLGYYSRGKNVLRAAKIIAQKYGGTFPREQKTLESLPGIGSYTASAIRAFAWDDPVAAIDTNVQKIIRVLWPRKRVEKMAQELVVASGSGRKWNNAMMDLATALRGGETISGKLGAFFPENVQQKFQPQRKKRSAKKPAQKKWRLEIGIACIHREGKYLIQTRPEDKTFSGQWEFPGGKRQRGESFRACVQREVREEIGVEVSVRPHFFQTILPFEKTDLLLRFHRCQIQKGEPKPLEGQKLDWVAPADFGKIDFLDTNAEALEKLKKMRV